MGLRNP